jgi:hypothetical protein
MLLKPEVEVLNLLFALTVVVMGKFSQDNFEQIQLFLRQL